MFCASQIPWLVIILFLLLNCTLETTVWWHVLIALTTTEVSFSALLFYKGFLPGTKRLKTLLGLLRYLGWPVTTLKTDIWHQLITRAKRYFTVPLKENSWTNTKYYQSCRTLRYLLHKKTKSFAYQEKLHSTICLEFVTAYNYMAASYFAHVYFFFLPLFYPKPINSIRLATLAINIARTKHLTFILH